MKHASLFTGIGGFDLAAEWMGWQNIFQVEIDDWCQRLLKQNFPNAERYKDIKGFSGGQYAGTVDVLSGGFPCQPYSTAGKRQGKKDDRHLWPEMLRIIREVSPRWVVGENVRGLVNWNAGLVFEEVQADLEAEGYEVLPFLLPAAGVNAPHRRDRIWFIAHSVSIRLETIRKHNQVSKNESQAEGQRNKGIWTEPTTLCQPEVWERFPCQPPICGGNDGVPRRVDRLKGLGNAVVPQLVYQIFKAIEQYGQSNQSRAGI